MAATGASSVKVRRDRRHFMTVLTYAACEWFLIFLLFIDGLLSYFLTKFASYCKLQTPCLLCSRLDHVLGDENPGFYRTLICHNHKSEISSLISCQIRGGNLVDDHGMCEDCLLSFSTNSKAVSDSQRLLGAKLGFKYSDSRFQTPILNKDLSSGMDGTQPCSCCNKLWSPRQHAQRLFQLKSTKPSIPRVPSRKGLNRRDSVKRIRAKFYGSVTSQQIVSSSSDLLSEVGYTELKITSDSESEVPFSDDDDGGNSMARAIKYYKQHISTKNNAQGNDLVLMKQECKHVNPGPLLIEPLMHCDVSESHDSKCSPTAVSIGHGLSELNWEQTRQEYKPHAFPELISLIDIPQKLNTVEGPFEESSKNFLTEIDHAGPSMHAEILRSTNRAEHNSDQSSDDRFTLNPSKMNPSMPLKPNVTNMGGEGFSSSTQEVSIKSPNDELQGHNDELEINDATSSNDVETLQKTDSVDRDEHGIESFDGSMVSEIDGESVVDRLKRQVEYDKKCMGGLYKELEEERNASAIAANQAMAMITRLQEEKAALHMEALQYLRMMEEQAEYDVEALEKANNLLAEKDKDMQDLEAELEFSRIHYADDLTVDSTHAEFKVVDKPENGKAPWLEFEDEKNYISESLKKLEKQIHGFYGDGALMHMPNGGYHENGANNHEEIVYDEGTQRDENGESISKDLAVVNGSNGKGKNHIDSDEKKSTINLREQNLGVLENEVSELNERLEALETNRNFLQHALNTLQNGKEGLEFIQEISHQLQEIRTGLRQRCQSVP